MLVKINPKKLIKLRYYFTFFAQLRVRDLEGALEVEKSEVKEVKYNLEALTKQHRFVSGEILLPRIIVITGLIQSLEFLKKS